MCAQDWETLNGEFKEMEAIYCLNVQFCERLTKCMADGHIAAAFTEAVLSFRSYSGYINGYDEALLVLANAKKANPALDAFLRVRSGPPHGWDMGLGAVGLCVLPFSL